MLTPMWKRSPLITKGSSMTVMARSARAMTASWLAMPSHRMTNSSPPKRDRVSAVRTTLRRRSATTGQELVAGPVAQAVVDQLEAVEVEEHHHRGWSVVAEAAGDGVAQAVDQQQAVGQAGERVVQGLMGQLAPPLPCAR